MKITLSPGPQTVMMKDAEAGKFYRDEKDLLYFVTTETATCLTDHGKTYPLRKRSELLLTEVLAGTVINIVV